MQKSHSIEMYFHKYLLLFQDFSDQADLQGQGRHSLRQTFTEKMFFACVP